MKIGTSTITAAVIGLMLATTGARAESPMDPDGASMKAHLVCGLKCGSDRVCYHKYLDEYRD